MDKKKPKIYMKCPKWDICVWVKRKKKENLLRKHKKKGNESKKIRKTI